MARILALALLAAALAGCVEYRERIELGRDGSGSVLIEIGVSETLARAAELAEARGFDRQRVAGALAGLEGVTLEGSSVASEGGTRWLRLRIRFESVEALAGLDRTPGYEGLFGGVRLRRAEPRGLVLIRRVALDPARFGGPATALLGPVLARYPWRFVIRLPTRVVAATGPGARVGEGRREARWALTLAEVLERPRTLEVRYARPGPGLLGVAAGAVLMLAAAALMVALRRRMRRAPAGGSPPA